MAEFDSTAYIPLVVCVMKIGYTGYPYLEYTTGQPSQVPFILVPLSLATGDERQRTLGIKVVPQAYRPYSRYPPSLHAPKN